MMGSTIGDGGTYCSVTHNLPPILPSIATGDDPSPCDSVISTSSSNFRIGGISPNDWGVEDVRDVCSSLDTVVGGVEVVSSPIVTVLMIRVIISERF